MESRLSSSTMERPNSAPSNLVGDFKAFIQRTEQRTVERAKAADRIVRGFPYQTIACVFGVGVLIGVLGGRKWKS
jgi:ElaB/YqjD/DUF883 family membrane-anchored ribosome-binding protein